MEANSDIKTEASCLDNDTLINAQDGIFCDVEFRNEVVVVKTEPEGMSVVWCLIV